MDRRTILTACLVTIILLLANAHASAQGIDVPKLDQISVDGDLSDWKDRGHAIDILTHAGRQRPATDDFDARVRLGWNDEGLLVAATIADGKIVEAADLPGIAMRDSFSIFVASKDEGRETIQILISPGLTAAQPKSRFHVIDRRPAANRRPFDKARHAVRKVAGGYELELLIPSDAIDVTETKAGRKLAAQVLVSDVDDPADPRDRLIWFPQEGAHEDASRMHGIYLSSRSSPAERVAVSVQDDRLRRYVLKVASREPIEGVITAHAGAVALGTATKERHGDVWQAALAFPLNRVDQPLTSIDVKQDGKPLASAAVPDLREQRLNAIDRLPLKFDSYVFSRDTFPAVDFENPERAEYLVGDYTLRTRFFDAKMAEVSKPTSPGRYGAVVEITAAGLEPIRRYATLYRMPQEFHPRDWEPRVDLALPPQWGVDERVVSGQSAQIDEHVKFQITRGLSQEVHGAVLLAGLHETPPNAKPGLTASQSAIGRDSAWWHQLRAKIGQPLRYRYLTHLPPSAEKNPEAKLPLILFLHGSGERGRDMRILERHGPRRFMMQNADQPFVVISPQCPAGERWEPLAINDLLDEVLAKHPNIDHDRIYITGLSMGSFGTYSVLAYHPERYAADVSICGGGDPNTVDAFADIPVWVVHGAQDKVVTPFQSERMVDALRRKGGRVRYTLDLDDAHDSWTATYNDPKVYAWLLAQKRGQPSEPKATVPGTQPSETR